MKAAQWTAVLVLALMVGGISFVSVYLGDTNRDNSDPAPPAELPSVSFPIKIFPREGEKTQTTEVQAQGYQDYWFVNDSGQDVPVGLNGKSCTCMDVEITVAPPSWMAHLVRSAVTQVLQQPPCGLDNLTTLVATCDRAHEFPEMPEDGESQWLTRAPYVTVPAGAVGRVRLSWHQPKERAFRAHADLWMSRAGGSANARLESSVLIAAPLKVNKEMTITAISERELEQKEEGQRGWIVCYSLTRPSFHIKAKVLHHQLQETQSDPVEVGEPIPLLSKDLRRLEEKVENLRQSTILSGYRIPVTVRARAKDGTPMEWGRFHRAIYLSSTDPGIEPEQVEVAGAVMGDIGLSGDEDGTINLGPFRRTHGAKRQVNLETDEKGIDLELDRTRMPKFLTITLSAPQAVGGHRSWVLRVEVAPNAARGEFPNPDNPDYRDCAIYVKTKEGKSGTSLRSIRIPVRGVAND